jgi:hypothetical protein
MASRSPSWPPKTEGRTSRIEGQRARTREGKLGCVFTQTSVDKDGWPIRDPDSTTYVGAVEIADEFGYRIYTEAWRRGWEWATTKIVIGDGAVWIWNLADRHFPGAIVGVRLKQSGMFWTVRGANAIIALRCCRFNQRFEDFWAETRAA